MKHPEPPVKRDVPPKKHSATVLTSSEHIEIMDKKEQMKKEKEELKARRKKEREEKKRLKEANAKRNKKSLELDQLHQSYVYQIY